MASEVVVTGKKYNCHTGQTRVIRVGGKQESEAGLYLGGWTRGAQSAGFHVIDLTGHEYDAGQVFEAKNKQAESAFASALSCLDLNDSLSWLSFPIKDYGVPKASRAQWEALAADILRLIQAGQKVLMCCTGGHGRTGTAGAILCGLLANIGDDPIGWLRGVYCDNAVETEEQHKYVHRILNLPAPSDDVLKQYAKTYAVTQYLPGGGYNYGGYGGWKADDFKNKADDNADTRQLTQIVLELDGSGIYNDVVDDQYVLVYLKSTQSEARLVKTVGSTGYKTADGKTVEGTDLMTEAEVNAMLDAMDEEAINDQPKQPDA